MVESSVAEAAVESAVVDSAVIESAVAESVVAETAVAETAVVAIKRPVAKMKSRRRFRSDGTIIRLASAAAKTADHVGDDGGGKYCGRRRRRRLLAAGPQGHGGLNMASERQIAANRRNAQKSTGPRSVEGKKRASRNAYRHGFAAGVHESHLESVAIEAQASSIAIAATRLGDGCQRSRHS